MLEQKWSAQAETRPDRVIAKDAADSYRLMLHLGAEPAVERFGSFLKDPIAGPSTRTALDYLRTLFGAPAAAGVPSLWKASALTCPLTVSRPSASASPDRFSPYWHPDPTTDDGGLSDQAP